MSKDMQIVAQLIDKKTGARTPPVTKTRREFADVLRELYPEVHQDGAYVLILADDSMKPGSLDFALAPLMTVKNFIKHFASANDLGD